MKTELEIRESSLVHRLMCWYKETGTKKISKFIFMYGLCVAIIGTFDYAWMPYLAVKFQYWAFFPLFGSLILVCFIGLGLYEFFKEDIFLKAKMEVSLEEEGKYKFTKWVKEKMKSSRTVAFVVISLENPLQAYIWFRGKDKTEISEATKMITFGSFCCAFFWSVVIDILVLFWNLGKIVVKFIITNYL